MSGLRRPLVLPRPTYYDSTSEYNSIDDSLNRVEYFSNAVLEDQYDAALRSRGRDDALLRNANATIEEPGQQSDGQAASEGAQPPSNTYSSESAMVAPSLKSLSMYSDLLSLTTDRPTPSLELEGVYYRPLISTSGLHASRPPMMAPNSVADEQALKASEDKIGANGNSAGNSANASSAEEAKKLDGSVNIPSYYACGGDPLNRPVTELRRKIRRMVATGKRNPNYYRMGLDA